MATRTKTTKKATKPQVSQASQTTALQSTEEQNALALMASQSGLGLESIDRSDLYIPRVKIIQSLSSELDSDDPNYIDGLRAGDIVESQSGINYGKEITFIPVKVIKSWVEWFPREDQRGIAHIYLDRDSLPAIVSTTFGENQLANGNRLQETYSFFGYTLFAGDKRETMIAFYSTQLKKAKQAVTLMNRDKMLDPSDKTGKRKIQPPIYYRSYRFGTIKEKNQKGHWYGWNVNQGKTIIDLAKEGQINLSDIFESWKSFADLATSKSSELLTSGLPDDGLQANIAQERNANSDDIPM